MKIHFDSQAARDKLDAEIAALEAEGKFMEAGFLYLRITLAVEAMTSLKEDEARFAFFAGAMTFHHFMGFCGCQGADPNFFDEGLAQQRFDVVRKELNDYIEGEYAKRSGFPFPKGHA